MRIVPVPCLQDNYAYLVVSDEGHAAIVDASEADPVRDALRREGVVARAIWTTHHHWDHVGGNEALARELGLEVVAHASDRGRVPALTRTVETGDVTELDEIRAQCIHIPGHTLGAVAYFIETGRERVVFTGDTLFCAGCGRLFEGTAEQMHTSLARLAQLPPSTRVYCGHEYTENNLRFAAFLEPSNEDVARARERARAARASGAPTVGTTLEEECRVNPFLRVRSPEIRAALHVSAEADDVTAFAAIRAAKDAFR
ncbi:MAG TPA: hydroxyacylglutathione hydrolase [Polyangiaceae bacterium]|nr:hydroxyacylglutathione hydrolase [Polyangiaceae bacterium]